MVALPVVDSYLDRRVIGFLTMPGKRIQFDDETFRALDLLARDCMMDFQELADDFVPDNRKRIVWTRVSPPMEGTNSGLASKR